MISMSMPNDDESHRPLRHIHHDAYLDEKIRPDSMDLSITSADILCGRGKSAYNHAGNRHFRKCVVSAVKPYVEANNRSKKSSVVRSTADLALSEGGRFLKQDSVTGRWYQMSMEDAREKVGRAIRDAVSFLESKAKLEGKPKATRRSASPRHSDEAKRRASSIEPSKSPVPSSGGQEGHRPGETGQLQATAASAAPTPVFSTSPTSLPAAAALAGTMSDDNDDVDLSGMMINSAATGGKLEFGELPDYSMLQAQGPTASASAAATMMMPPQPVLLPTQGYQEEVENDGNNGGGGSDEDFLRTIEDTLGPLAPGARDPLNSYLNE